MQRSIEQVLGAFQEQSLTARLCATLFETLPGSPPWVFYNDVAGATRRVHGNGQEALRMWREGSYALLLTDLHMPDMDGYTLTESIRQEEATRPGGRRMPILALTANALHGEAMRALASGMDDYMTKPLQLDMLRAALERWMQPRQADQPASVY